MFVAKSMECQSQPWDIELWLGPYKVYSMVTSWLIGFMRVMKSKPNVEINFVLKLDIDNASSGSQFQGVTALQGMGLTGKSLNFI